MPTDGVTSGKQGEWRGWSPTSSNSGSKGAVSSPAPTPAPAPVIRSLETEPPPAPTPAPAPVIRSLETEPPPAPKSTICAWLSSWCCCNSNGDQSDYQVAPE